MSKMLSELLGIKIAAIKGESVPCTAKDKPIRYKQWKDDYTSEIYSKKQVVYAEGKRPRYLYYINSGKVKAYKTHKNGKEYITDLYSNGDFLGYAALIEDRNYDDTAVALEESGDHSNSVRRFSAIDLRGYCSGYKIH